MVQDYRIPYGSKDGLKKKTHFKKTLRREHENSCAVARVPNARKIFFVKKKCVMANGSTA